VTASLTDTRSAELYRRALELIPGGVNSPVRAMQSIGREPIFIARGEGAELVDVDGNRFVDYVCSWGPLIHGHAKAEILEAIASQAALGTTYGAPTAGEVDLACEVSRRMEGVEMIRMTSSGTEATMTAMRLVRAATGRERILKFAGAYHGHVDGLLVQAGSGLATQALPASPGVTASAAAGTIVIPWNDPGALREACAENELAAIFAEPLPGNMGLVPPQEGFLDLLREQADACGALLVLDEVISGFRVARGGAQELMGVRADIVTMAKAMANGYPIAAIGGRGDIMRCFGRGVAHGGTYTAHPVALAAAEKTLDILDETPALETIAAYGGRLQAGITRLLEARGVVDCFAGHPSMAGLFFAPEPPRDFRDWRRSDFRFYDALARELHEEGVLCEPDSREPWFVCEAHDDWCLADTLAGFERALDRTLDAVAAGVH